MRHGLAPSGAIATSRKRVSRETASARASAGRSASAGWRGPIGPNRWVASGRRWPAGGLVGNHLCAAVGTQRPAAIGAQFKALRLAHRCSWGSRMARASWPSLKGLGFCRVSFPHWEAFAGLLDIPGLGSINKFATFATCGAAFPSSSGISVSFLLFFSETQNRSAQIVWWGPASHSSGRPHFTLLCAGSSSSFRLPLAPHPGLPLGSTRLGAPLEHLSDRIRPRHQPVLRTLPAHVSRETTDWMIRVFRRSLRLL
jgi:hypothetical protein